MAISINDAKNLLVDWLNKKQATNVQTNTLKNSATNTKNTWIKLPNSTASTDLKTWTKNKLQEKGLIQPTTTTTTQNKQTKQQILDNNSTAQKLKQLSLQNNVNYVANQQNQGSRFIWFQNNNQTRPLTDLAWNIIQENLDAKRKSEFDRILSKPILNIPTKKSEIEEYNKKEKERYRTDEQVIKDFHYDVRNSNWTLTKEQISQLYPEFQGKEDIALMLQADLLPLVQNDEFADMKKLAEVYPELLSKQKKVWDQILKDQEKQGKEIKDLAKKAEKTLSRYNVLSKNWQQYMEDVYQIWNYVDMIRAEYRLPWNPSDIDIINFGKQNIPEVKEILDDMERLKSNYNLTERDRDIILNNWFDIWEWLYQAWADIQNFTQHNQLWDYLDKKSSTWERQLSNLWINGGSANTIANLPKKAVNTAEIPVNMVWDLSSWLWKVGIATERIATQQNRNEDWTTDMNWITQDLIKWWGWALSVAFNTVMAIPTALFHLAEDTDAGSAAIDGTLWKMQKELDNLQSWKTTNSDNAFTQWYNWLDEEAKADLLNEEIMAIFHSVHKWSWKVKKVWSFEIKSAKNAINDVIRQKYSIESNNANFKAKVEQGLADGTMKVTDDWKLTDRDWNNIGKVKVHKIKTKDKIKYVVDKVISDNRAARNAKSLWELNPNALPDNRTFREKSEEKAYNAGVKTREIYDTAKEWIDTVKKWVKSINVWNAVKGTSEMAGKGVKATSDLYNAWKNVLSKWKNKITSTVKNTINENIVEPYRKGRWKTNQLNTEWINQWWQVQESNSTLKTDTKINWDNYNQKKTNSKKLNKAQLQLLQTNNRMNPKSIDTFKEWYGTEYWQRMYDRWFTKSAEWGNLKEMENYKNSLLSQKRETLNKIEWTYQDISLSDMADHLVEKAETVKNRKLLKEAKKLRDKHNETWLTMPEADRLRALFTQNVKMWFHQDIPADARERAKNEYLAVKDFLDDIWRKNWFDDLDRINREIQQVQHIIKWVESKMNRQSANNEYTLTDYILMAEAFTSPESAALFTAKQILKHPKVRNAILDKAVWGKKNSQNKITADTRKATNENVENIAKAKRWEKLQSDLSKSDIKWLPYKEWWADNGKNILANGKTIITDWQWNSWVKGQITEIDKRKNKPKDATPPTEWDTTENKSETPKTESKPKNKVTAKKPVEKKSETKPESKEEVKTETKEQVKEQPKEQVNEQVKEETKTTDEQPKNVVTKKSAVTTKKSDTKKNATAKEQLQAIVNKYKDIQMDDFSDENSEWWWVNSQKFKNFAKELKKSFQTIATENWLELTNYNVWYYEVSADFKNETWDSYYVKVWDTRDPEWRDDVLYRKATDNKNARDSSNMFGKLENLSDLLKPNAKPEWNVKNFMNVLQRDLNNSPIITMNNGKLNKVTANDIVKWEEKSESTPKEEVKTEEKPETKSDVLNTLNNLKEFSDLGKILNLEKVWEKDTLWTYKWELNWTPTAVWQVWDSTIFVKYGNGEWPAQARIDLWDSDAIGQLQELLTEIYNDGEILESNRNNPYNTKTEITWEKNVVTAKSVDKKENTNIIGKNNSLTSKNPINERNNKASSGKENEWQSELSNTVKNVQSNEWAGERPTDKWPWTSDKATLNTSGNATSEHWAWLTNGGTPNGVQPHKSIRTKWDNVITEKTVTQARDINRDCVDILEKHEFSDNPKDYTAEEIEILRQYEWRWGINDKEDTQTQWALNQYYTKDNIIKAMWRLLEWYNNTDILEPSMWVGRFFMYAPEWSNLAWFEYDKIPWTIAKILYPNADIKIGDFQDNFMLGKFSMWDNYTGKKYDIVIWNPPYEERQGRQKALGEEPKINRFDDYFIKRWVDMLKPWGHLAFVTSSQFLRWADNYAKQKISENAELIDAYRIPIWAFDRTWVETDIIVLRKKEWWWDASLLSASKWFDEHPDKVLWEERDDVQWRFWPKKAVVWDLSAIDEIWKARVWTDWNPATIKSDFTPMKEVKQEQPKTQKTIEAKQEQKVKPKKEIKPSEWKDWTETKEKWDWSTETITWWKSLNGIVFKGKGWATGRMVVGKWWISKYQNLLNANGKIWDPDIKLEDDREWLNYIAWELEPNLLYASRQIPLKLEQLEKDYQWWFIDEKQYNKQRDLLEQAIPQEIDYQNIYFSPYLEWILDFPTNELKSGWVNGERADVKATVRDLFKRRIGEKETSYGNITYEKKTKDWIDIITARAWDVMLDIIDNKWKGYPKEAKEKVITMLPKEYNKFLKWETLDAETKTELQKAYNTKYNSYANFDYSDLWYTVDDISPTFRWDTFNISDVQARGISRILTTESMIIAHWVWQWKTIEWIIGAIASMQQWKARKALIVVPAGTKADRMQTTAQLFPNQEMVDLWSLAKWTWIRKRLVEMYWPDPRDWIQDWQLVFLEHSAIWRQISFKNDTLTELEQSLTDAMESHFEEEKNIEDSKKQLERASKDLARAKEKWASAADIEKKQKKMDEILWDIQRMWRTTENSLQDIMNTYRDKWLPDDWIWKALEFIDDDYDEFLHNMNEYLDNEINVWGAKINKAQALEVANDIFNNERAIYLEDLGIDHLTVDEAHNFRNLFNKSITDDEEWGSYHAGMQTKEWSKQAKNLYAMSQYIMSKNGGGNVILLTATPFINNPSEMYNMLSYVGKNGMYEMWVQSMDDFYDNFVWLENRLTPTASTSWVTYKNVMVWFHNTETLVKNLLDRYIDYEWESWKVVKPRLVTNVVRLKMSDTQMKVQKKLEEQIDKNEFDDEWEWSVVKTRKLNDKWEAKWAVLEWMTQANLNLISPYLTKYLKDKLPSITAQELIESSPKLKYQIEAIKLEREMWIMRGTFLYMEQWKELHEKLKKAIEDAIPWIKVWIINWDKKYSDLSSKEAEKLWIDPEWAKARQTAKKFSNWELDVLIWGANTKEWLNLQGNWYHLIEISQPRNLNDRIQLIGRMQRQWNLSNEVLDTLLLMENSSDIYRFELMSRKWLRRNILEQLAAYKRWEDIEEVVVDWQLDMDEEKLALFTDPEKKAKVSITMEKTALTEQKNQTNWQIASIKKLIDLMAGWKNDYWWYRKLWEWTTRMDKLYDEDHKAITTDILDENALEPLEQQLDYAWNEAMKKMEEFNSRRTDKWTKAEMEKNIKKNSPYSYEAMKWKEIKDKLQQARSERNLVIRQTDQLWIKTERWLSDFILELEQQQRGIESKLSTIENTKNEKVEMFKAQAEANKANEMDIETMLRDLEEDYRHQVTLWSKEELRNWIELTKNLPKREQARSKNAVTGGKNKYSWKSEDYVWKKATFEKPKNLITSKHTAYDESNPKPETKYIWYTPKEIIKTKEWWTLTKIWFQQQFQKMNNTLNNIKKNVTEKEEKKSYRMQNDVQEILWKDEYYTWLKTRLTNMILKFAKRYDDEIIKAYKKDNPWKTPTWPEDFYNYINNYWYFASADKVSKVEDEYVKPWAEYLFNKYNWAGRNNVTANDKNKITNW